MIRFAYRFADPPKRNFVLERGYVMDRNNPFGRYANFCVLPGLRPAHDLCVGHESNTNLWLQSDKQHGRAGDWTQSPFITPLRYPTALPVTNPALGYTFFMHGQFCPDADVQCLLSIGQSTTDASGAPTIRWHANAVEGGFSNVSGTMGIMEYNSGVKAYAYAPSVLDSLPHAWVVRRPAGSPPQIYRDGINVTTATSGGATNITLPSTTVIGGLSNFADGNGISTMENAWINIVGVIPWAISDVDVSFLSRNIMQVVRHSSTRLIPNPTAAIPDDPITVADPFWYPVAPMYVGNDEEWARRTTDVINGAMQGHMNLQKTVTLTANAATTVVTDPRATSQSDIMLMPLTPTAADEIGAGTMYVSSRGTQTFTITHANNAYVSRTFVYAITG